jgi:hypothetical protein
MLGLRNGVNRKLASLRQGFGQGLFALSYQDEAVGFFHSHVVSQVAEGLLKFSEQPLGSMARDLWRSVIPRENPPQAWDPLLGIDKQEAGRSGGEQQARATDGSGLVEPIEGHSSRDDSGWLQADVH